MNDQPGARCLARVVVMARITIQAVTVEIDLIQDEDQVGELSRAGVRLGYRVAARRDKNGFVVELSKGGTPALGGTFLPSGIASLVEVTSAASGGTVDEVLTEVRQLLVPRKDI